MSKLYFRYGAMNCGKTTALLQVAHNYEERGMSVLIIKPIIDKKAADSIESRLGIRRKVDYLIKDGDNLYKILKDYKKNDKKLSCILVDEAHFIEEEQVDQLFKFATLENIPVICYGLRSDFKTKAFRAVPRLLTLASTIEEMKTICRCGKKATLNLRFVNGKIATDGEQVAIDGFDNVTYESMCPACYFKALKNSTK